MRYSRFLPTFNNDYPFALSRLLLYSVPIVNQAEQCSLLRLLRLTPTLF